MLSRFVFLRLCFVVALSLGLGSPLRAASGGPAPRCDLNDFLVRAVSRATGIEVLKERLENFSRTPLVRELEAIHVHLFQDHRLRARTFNLMWIFRDKEATSLLLNSFDGALVSSVDEKGQEKQLKPVEFVEEYQRCFEAAGGRISSLWDQPRQVEGKIQSDKERFLKRLYLELAYRHQQSLNAEREQQPVNYVAAQDSDVSFLAAYADLNDHFGSAEAFRREFEVFARRRERVRTPYQAFQTSPEYRRVRRELVGAGQLRPNEAQQQPIRRLDQRDRDRDELLQEVAEAISLNTFPEGFELAGAMVSTTDTEFDSHFQLMGGFYERVRALGYGNLDAFVGELNTRLAPPLLRPSGMRSWAQELLVQCGALHARQAGRPFSGFHTMDESDVFFVNMQSQLVRASGLSLLRLNQLVAERLNP